MITDIDANGRIQLPLIIRLWLDLYPGDRLAVDQLGDGTIILKKIEGEVLMEEAVCSGSSIKETIKAPAQG
ncbi:Uncharacterised protein [uncultured archaeon]|nr:Uncharacterised protein [uncultured archaeon]